MKIIIKNSSWEILKSIDSIVWKTLLEQITNSWIEMHFACNAWICWACMCSIEKWQEFIKKDFKTEPWFPLWEDEVMTCIWWIISDESSNNEIVLKTIY